MAVRKKNKIGGFMATILIIAFISAAMIVVLMDQDYKAKYALAEDYVSDSHDIVKDSINGIKDVLAELIEGIQDYDGIGMESADWEGASEIHNEKRKEMEDFLNDYLKSFADEKKGLTYKDYFNYYVNDDLIANSFVYLWEDAKIDLGRAPSVDAMNKIVEKFKKDVKAISTNIQRLYAILDQIDKNGVELSDFSDYLLAEKFYSIIDADIYALDPDNDVYEQADMIKRLDDLFEAFKPLAIDAFIEIANKLPENINHLTKSKDEATVISGREAYDALIKNKFYTAQELKNLKNEDFHDAEKLLLASEFHMEVLNKMYGSLDKDTKQPIKGNNALWINAQIDSYSKTTIKADPETKIWIEQLLSYVDTWDNTVWESRGYQYTLVTRAKDKNYCEETYYMIKRDVLAGYVKTFETEVAKIREEADHFIYMVGKLPTISYKVDYEISIIEDIIGFVNEASKSLAFDKVDFVLGYGASEGVNNAYITFLRYKDEYKSFAAHVDNTIKRAEELMKSVLNTAGNAVDTTKVTAAIIAEVDGIIRDICGKYDLDEEKFNSKLLEFYKEARLTFVKKQALDNAKIAHTQSSFEHKDDGYEALLRMIEIDAATNYYFDVDSNGELIEATGSAEKGPSKLLAKYTVDECFKIINSIDINK